MDAAVAPRIDAGDGDAASRVSVIVPCFNQAHFLTEAIESILRQGHPGVDVTVVDDGSDDNSYEVAGRYPGVRRLRQPHLGVAAARNLGLAESAGELVVFLDADDRLPPQALEAGLRALERRPECAAVIGPPGSATPAVYRRSLFEHLRTFDPRLGDAAGLGFDLAVVRKFPAAGLPAAGADELARLLGETLATQAGRSLRERRFGDALRELALLARHRFGAPPRPDGSDRSRPG